jgi:hypothetical protein
MHRLSLLVALSILLFVDSWKYVIPGLPVYRLPIRSFASIEGSNLKSKDLTSYSNDADTEAIAIGVTLPSALGVDYVPLATMLATGDFFGADQFTRDNLIRIAGKEAINRGFVYFTDVKRIPKQDLVTMEKLWLQYSEGKFGYSVQQRLWETDRGNFDNFIRRIGWTIEESGVVRKRKWFGKSEFIYEVETAPRGHLPLTSALRGTQLLRCLMELEVWKEYDWKNYNSVPWNIK